MTLPPLSLYVHIPWCVRKCPYCDFNSHTPSGDLPIKEYLQALRYDLDQDLGYVAGRPIESVFLGGGTPSLFPAQAIADLLCAVADRVALRPGAEVTMEANPGTLEHGRFDAYQRAGVNRLSVGVQTFDDAALGRIGRIHSGAEALRAVRGAQEQGLANINIDLMYALPQQTLEQARADVLRAMELQPTHISHYQLTLEPNTEFAKRPPPLPDHDQAWEMQETCQELLEEGGYPAYEVSAYAPPAHRCYHNMAYWRFADYLGIGAGAHGKVTQADGRVLRTRKVAMPRSYLERAGAQRPLGSIDPVPARQLPFEYMLNALRLHAGFSLGDFEARTGLPRSDVLPTLERAEQRGWLLRTDEHYRTSVLGQRFLNDVIMLFLPD